MDSTTSENRFFIDGKPYTLACSPQKATWLLQLAQTSPSDTILVSEDGVEHDNPDELIDIHPDERFETRKRGFPKKLVEKPIRYRVNGEEHTTMTASISLRSILESAGKGAAIDTQDLDSYYLENTVDGRKYEHLDDLVPVSDGDNFVAIHVGRTPVA